MHPRVRLAELVREIPVDTAADLLDRVDEIRLLQRRLERGEGHGDELREPLAEVAARLGPLQRRAHLVPVLLVELLQQDEAVEQAFEATKIDPWFLANIAELIETEGEIRRAGTLERAGTALLRRAKGMHADLSGARLAYADLSRAFLVRADLSGADLSHANLTGTVLTGASLVGASLVGADLTGAVLVGADTRDADFSDARLDGTRFGDPR